MDEATRRLFGRTLRQMRIDARLSQHRLADWVPVSQATLSRYESGSQAPDAAMAARLDELLDTGGTLGRLAAGESAQTSTALSSVGHTRRPLPDSLMPPVVAVGDGLDSMRAMSCAFQTADRQVGGGRLYGIVVRYLTNEVSPRLLDAASGGSGGDLFSAAASLTEIAGWMAHDCGVNDRARRHFDHAFRLSSAAGNVALTANVCASMAHLAVQIDKPADAVRIADAGLARATSARGTRHLRARLCAMRARGLAVKGDAAGSLDAIHTAEKLLDDTHAERDAEWIANFDLGSLSSEVALCFRALGKLKGAERSALKAIELRNGDRIRSRAFAQLTLAEVLTASGRIDEAATIGLSVCQLMPGLNSARVETGLSRLTASLEKYSAVREVCELLASWENVKAQHARAEGDIGWPV